MADKTGVNGNNLTEIQIVPPREQSVVIDHGDADDEVNGPALPVVDNDTPVSSDEYETAGSDASGSESEAEPAQQSVNVPPVQPGLLVSRYGRVIRPRQMYGFD